jgi:hypothetical protein
LSRIVGFAFHRLWLRHGHLLTVTFLTQTVEYAGADEKRTR